MTLDRLPGVQPLLFKIKLLSSGQSQRWSPEVKRCDIRKLPYADDSVDAIYSQHVLEHLYLSDVRLVLAEAYRVMRPGAVIRTNVPNAEINARMLLDGECGNFATAGANYNYHLLAWPEQRPTKLQAARNLIGGHVHKWQPTPGQLRYLLEQSGFVNISGFEFRVGTLPDLATIESRDNSIYIEARKE